MPCREQFGRAAPRKGKHGQGHGILQKRLLRVHLHKAPETVAGALVADGHPPNEETRKADKKGSRHGVHEIVPPAADEPQSENHLTDNHRTGCKRAKVKGGEAERKDVEFKVIDRNELQNGGDTEKQSQEYSQDCRAHCV